MKDDFELFPGGGSAAGDHDISLISAYLAGELSLVQVAAVEERLSSDRAFREKVKPILDVWLLPMSFAAATAQRMEVRSHDTLTATEIEAGWQRIAQGAGTLPARPCLVAAREHPTTSRRKIMIRAASIVAAVALPMVGLAQVAMYAAKHQDAPGHAVARQLIQPFIQRAPEKRDKPIKAPAITVAEERLGTSLASPPESVASAGKDIESLIPAASMLMVASPLESFLPVVESLPLVEGIEPDRARIAALVSQYQPDVTRGSIAADYVVLVFDAKGEYRWSTHGAGGVRIQVGGDSRSLPDRIKYEMKYRGQLTGDSTSPERVAASSARNYPAFSAMRDSAFGRARFSLKRPDYSLSLLRDSARMVRDSLIVKRKTMNASPAERKLQSSREPAFARFDSLRGFARGAGRFFADTAAYRHIYKAGWSGSRGSPENKADGLESPTDGKSGIIALPDSSVALADSYTFRPGELAPSQLRVLAVYLAPGVAWKP